MMPTNFDLIITADYPNRTAEFRLLDAHGVQIGLPVRRTSRPFLCPGSRGCSTCGTICATMSSRIGRRPAWPRSACASPSRCWARTSSSSSGNPSPSARCASSCPGPPRTENLLAAALARVPWEIARPGPGPAHPGRAEPPGPRGPRHGRAAYAAAGLWRRMRACGCSSSSPRRAARVRLAARQERRELLRLFEKEIYPHRRVVADFLTHGVTRERLEAQIADSGGYHVVHWSGHGHLNLLELAKPGGARTSSPARICWTCSSRPAASSPACSSSAPAIPATSCGCRDWNDFLAIAQGKEPGAKRCRRRRTRTSA